MNVRHCFLAVLVLLVGTGARAQGWQELAPMPTARYGAAITVLDDFVFIMGGRSASGQVLDTGHYYEVSTNSWTPIAQLRRPRVNAAAAPFFGRILLIGGRDDEGEVRNDVDDYDPQLDDWEGFFDDLNYEREGPAAFTIDNEVYVFGGSDAAGTFRGDCEYFSLSGEWEPYTPWSLSEPRAAFGAVPDLTGVTVFGGFSQFGPLADAERYEPGVGGTPIAPLPEARGALASAGDGTRVFAIGGRNAAGQVVSRVDVYVPSQNQWVTTTPLPQPREGAVAAVVGEWLYVFGGRDAAGNVLTSTIALRHTTASEDETPGSAALALMEPHPNPFHDRTRVELEVAAPGVVLAEVFDALGRRVAVLSDGPLGAGRHTLTWNGAASDGRPLAAGVYLVRVRQGVHTAARRLTLVR